MTQYRAVNSYTTQLEFPAWNFFIIKPVAMVTMLGCTKALAVFATPVSFHGCSFFKPLLVAPPEQSGMAI
jgi:hypothetical protein